MDTSEQVEIALLISRKHDALSQLFSRHQGFLRNMIAARLDRRLAARVDANDVLQETFLDASRRIDQYLDNPRVPFRQWLGFLAEQNVVDAYRRHFATKKRSVGAEQPMLPETRDGLPSYGTDPKISLLRGERTRVLCDSLKKLSPAEQDLIRQRYFKGKRIAEIADDIGVSAEAAQKRVLRSIKKLSALMATSSGSVIVIR